MNTLLRKINHRRRARKLATLGSLAGDGQGSLGADTATVISALTTGLDIAADPYLPEVICRMKQVGQVEKGQAVQACASTPLNLTGGAGLRGVIVPLRGYAYAQQHKWIYAVAAIGLIGLPILAGYELARARSKS